MSYLVGLASCSLSQTVVDKRWLYNRVPAPTNGLLMAKLVTAGFIEDVLLGPLGIQINSGTFTETILLGVSVAAVAALFPGAVWLLRDKRQGIRAFGLLLTVVLLLMTF
jgi:hypothetical protein